MAIVELHNLESHERYTIIINGKLIQSCSRLTTAMPRKAEPAPNTRFEFITIDNPSQATSALVRRQVRSHVTELQHRKKNENKTSRVRFAHDFKTKTKSKSREKQKTHGKERIELPSIADLTNPLAAAFARGTLAFQLYTLNDSENVVGKILSHMGTDALGLLAS